jgi:hypothetical protein
MAKLREVELQAASLDAAQLRLCLQAAWAGWLLERRLLLQALELHGVDVTLRPRNYTPNEILGI